MAHVIAIAGKGGVGKTTLTGLLVQQLCKSGKKPLLVVDADANANLNEVFGVEAGITLGELREEIENAGNNPKSKVPIGMIKKDYLEVRLHDALIEEEGFDLMIMGRSQGEGCYCFVNGLVQAQIQRLQNNYPYIVVDNEAGMEHISRGVLPKIDTMILVSDCSRRGIQAAGRIAELTKEMHINPGYMGLIVNRAPEGKINQGTAEEIENQKLNLLGIVPQDELVYQYDSDGRPLAQLPEKSLIRNALQTIVDKINF